MGDKERIRTAYELLEKEIFHKDGIPTALLIEIVPEIEQEASKILRDLSNGRMDINFKFGRKTKTGKVTEELIVEAVDQGRSHPVSRYSGGERMRINLALRLGVSEAITRRSGYRGRIETLVIDEGFGALDEEGRRATIEILQALRQRFKKILVISHIDDVREAFETRHRGADGYIVKPYAMEDLLRKIKGQLQKQREARKFSEEKVKEFIEARAEEYESRA
ncbi:MAG: SbcC/MukB-like Walker B domain-containing protein [Candidatus Bathyarchaeia archaeon]|jgi:exonuclease SbcC